MREERRRARAGGLPDTLGALGETGDKYFGLLAASRRSLRLEEERLVLLAELFGVSATASAMLEVMKTGHVGAEYVEHVIRFKRRLAPSAPPLRLGDPALDALAVREPDLALYDEICARRTKDPGEPVDHGGGEPWKDDDKLAMILAQLRWLKLTGMARALEALLTRAKKTNMTPLDIVGALADAEKASRIGSAIKRRVRGARFAEMSTIDNFDFDFDPVRASSRGPYASVIPGTEGGKKTKSAERAAISAWG